MNRRTVGIVLVIGVALALSTTLLILRRPFRHTQVELSGSVKVYLHLYTSPEAETLAAMLDEFSSFYPDIDLQYSILPYRELRAAVENELARGDGSAVVASRADGQGVPWTSLRWGLYFDRNRLERAGWTKEKLESLASEGMDVFTETLTPELKPGETLFALGTSFHWPWLAWLQHLQLASTGGTEPAAYSPADWRQGLSAWEALRDRGLFTSDYAGRNQAESSLAITRGGALFVLSDTTIFDVYPPSERERLEQIPFPGSISQGWRVGSSFSLEVTVPETTPTGSADAAAELVRYLHSEGIRRRFLLATGTMLLPETGEEGVREIPSITQRAGDPELRDLLAAGRK